MAGDKILSLESLRGIAALSVALFHFRNGNHFENAFIKNGWLMVDFFFVLSGFVIALHYANKITNFQSFGRYQYARFLRLYPLHLLMLFCLLLIEIAKYFVEKGAGLVANNPAFSKNNSVSFVENIFLIQNWVNPHLTWNGQSWSTSAEFYVYAIFGFTMLFLHRPIARVIAALVLVALAGSLLSTYGFGTTNVSGPARCVYGFFLGVLTFFLFDYFSLAGRVSSSLPALFLLFAAIFGVATLGHETLSDMILALPILFAATVLAMAATDQKTWIISMLSHKVLVYLGTISYGIYMIHNAVWWLIRQILRFVLKLPSTVDEAGVVTTEIGNPFLADAIILLGLGVVIILSAISYHFFESKFKQSYR